MTKMGRSAWKAMSEDMQGMLADPPRRHLAPSCTLAEALPMLDDPRTPPYQPMYEGPDAPRLGASRQV
ncbi:hypothetical protein GCM10010411_60040 [Actinomadura fulvescens]|uniref:Uncharacterized protein n=1 Tax=Actinomadura fulvescens TaxID=46160 RepID=A0ABN3Q590_9ACTN